MPLIIDGKPLGQTIPTSLQELWQSFPTLKEASKKLRDTPSKVMNPKGLLFVGQREFAGTSPTNDSISFIGTDSATTCHIVILRETGSGTICLGHFDGMLTGEAIFGMVKTILDIAGSIVGRFELILAGGFDDERGLSVELSESLLYGFNLVPLDIHLMAAAITDLNTEMKNGVPFPVIYGIGVDMSTQEIFPATFVDRGPDYPIRNAQTYVSHLKPCFPCLYDFQTRKVVIDSFDYSSCSQNFCETMISLSDEEILKDYSTSPRQEPPNFPDDFRNVFKFMLDNPKPFVSVFPNHLPRHYKQSSEVDVASNLLQVYPVEVGNVSVELGNISVELENLDGNIPKFDKIHLKKVGDYINRNVVQITLKMRTAV